MNVFTRMVQNKRAKMLTLTVLLTLALFIKQSTSINLTYIVRKEGDRLQPNCIAEENERYAAVGWVYPLPSKPEDDPVTTTKFVPPIQNDYNCKFGKNDKCTKFWSIRNWEVDDNSTRTLEPTFDSRWEDFPTIFTGSGVKEFGDRVEVPGVFRAGLSVRAADAVELLLCEGWNPYSYPCYHLGMGKSEIFLRKYMALPKNLSEEEPALDSYKAFTNILSEDEWRNFVVSLDGDGTLSLSDVNVNRTVIQYHDKKALKPLYLSVRSAEPALWKIHQNNFLYTKTAQISRLGPILDLPSKSLCVALYVSTCKDCTMDFFIMKDSNSTDRTYLEAVGPTQEFQWKMIKLKAQQIQNDKLNIFVETKFVNKATVNRTEGFWAIDDVRVCQDNEVKVTSLKLKEDESSDDVSCHVVQHPRWRPRKLVYSKLDEFPDIDSVAGTSSISLNWTQEDPNNEINYFITYQANDLCAPPIVNLRRIKSNGFLRTKHNEITIENLIPYTRYNITFTSTLHTDEKKLFVTTLESERPTPEELPSRLQIRQTDTQANASWDKVGCESIYGHLIYSIRVTNTELNSTKDVGFQTQNTVQITDLEPFTLYTFDIVTARNVENIRNDKDAVGISLNFTTRAGMASPVRNLEVYSADEKSVSFRYDLPKKPKGRPALVQVLRCSAISFYKCKPTVLNLTKCKLWPRKYCFDIDNLIPNQDYNFKVSIKNANTNIYGKETAVKAWTSDHIPAPPTDLAYKTVDCASDYCHLNISWLHPYNQNGTISSFHIVLNGTGHSAAKDIQEILQIVNKTYQNKYEYQIKYVPYSTQYELYVQSANSKYKSEFAHVRVQTGDVVLVEKKYSSVTFQLPPLPPKVESYTVTVVVQDFDKDKDLPRTILKSKKVASNLCHRFGNTWILPELEIYNTTNFTVGSGDPNNKYLEGDTLYCITFILTNKDSERNVVYQKKVKTPPNPNKDKDTSADAETSTKAPATSGSSQFNHLYILLVLLLLVPIGFLVFWYFKKRRPKPKQRENKENVYESLPFEECEENCVTNETYDHLLHK